VSLWARPKFDACAGLAAEVEVCSLGGEDAILEVESASLAHEVRSPGFVAPPEETNADGGDARSIDRFPLRGEGHAVGVVDLRLAQQHDGKDFRQIVDASREQASPGMADILRAEHFQPTVTRKAKDMTVSNRSATNDANLAFYLRWI
jgi:hypothetical protein